MSNRTNTKSYAEEGLEEMLKDTSQAEANLESATTGLSTAELQQVGGLEPISFFYRTSAPKKPTSSPYKVLEKGQVITGTYEKSFNSGKFKTNTYIIRDDNDGKLVGLPGTGSLSKAMDKLAEGSKVKITYKGMETIKGGEWAGQDAHVFLVFGNKFKQA